jgi:division protein 1
MLSLIVIVTEIENKLEDMQEEEAQNQPVATPRSPEANDDSLVSEDPAMDASFMSESIYQKLPSPRSLKHRSIRAFVSLRFRVTG